MVKNDGIMIGAGTSHGMSIILNTNNDIVFKSDTMVGNSTVSEILKLYVIGIHRLGSVPNDGNGWVFDTNDTNVFVTDWP